MKRLVSLRVMLALSDRKGTPVGNLAEITTKAKAIATDDVEVVTEEEDDCSYDDNGIESVNGEIEQTEVDGIQEADNASQLLQKP